jgi:L-threonylcarbamoyladenylate synthase
MFIKVKVFPKSKKTSVIQKSNNSFEIRIKSKPERGEANKEVMRALAVFFNIRLNQIRLIKGKKQRNKIFELPSIPNQIERAVDVLKRGGIIAYPTDTVYGVGCNIFDEKAIKRIFRLKKRNFDKPLSVAVCDFKMLEQLVVITEKDKKIIKRLLPGPTTVILPKKPIVSDLITNGTDYIGIRIPKDIIALEIIKKSGFPIISTSANISGQEPVNSAEKVDLKVDFVVKGKCKYKKPSTIIDFKNKKIIRQGAGKINIWK